MNRYFIEFEVIQFRLVFVSILSVGSVRAYDCLQNFLEDKDIRKSFRYLNLSKGDNRFPLNTSDTNKGVIHQATLWSIVMDPVRTYCFSKKC